jgi:hypothetical protein
MLVSYSVVRNVIITPSLVRFYTITKHPTTPLRDASLLQVEPTLNGLLHQTRPLPTPRTLLLTPVV